MSPVEEETMTPASHAVRIPMSSRLQSPTPNPFPLGSNDDDLERAQARAARAASIRRKSVVTAAASTSLPSDPNLIDRDQIMDLMHNCIKLASENKINQKNTWELKLIDHLSDIIQSKPGEDDAENNFQKASCTLEAGVKIYSLRVDSLHSEAYKVLGRINRVGMEEVDENATDRNPDRNNEQEEVLSRKNVERKLSPLSTLEASFDALNIKKFDVAFSVDPLYHQTSAQFDEGGAQGLLLNNLSVYGNCHVLFDSFEVPEKFVLNDSQNDKSEMIDLSFLKEYLDQMVINVAKKFDISPALSEIMNLFGENNHRQQNLHSVEDLPIAHGETNDSCHTQPEDKSFDDFVPDDFDHDDLISVVDDNSTIAETSFTSHLEEIGDCPWQSFDSSLKVEELADFLSYSLGFTSKTNAWAGPDFWKYKKSKAQEQVSNPVETPEKTANKKNVKKSASDIEFVKLLEKDFSNIFEAPKNPKSLLLPTNRASCKFTLPEDFHYKPESLSKFFLLPDVMFFGKKKRKWNDESEEPNDEFAPESWDQESINNDSCNGGIFNDDINDPESLVHLPRQVNKVDVQYDKVSKQVDVHALKETLWTHMCETVDIQQQQQQEDDNDQGKKGSISFAQAMHSLKKEHTTDSEKDISPHLFFICLLHLANEHGLTLLQSTCLKDVIIQFPKSV